MSCHILISGKNMYKICKPMNINLQGKCAIVCGSTRGLGWASAFELSLLGAQVILMARDEIKLKEAVGRLDVSQGQRHGYLVADFTQPESVQQAIARWVTEGGVAHILVNNTGGPAGGTALEAKPADYLQAFQQHLINNQSLVQALVPGMKEAGYGRIVNVISTSVKQPIPGLGVSNTIRAAVANWSKTLSAELAPFGITVNNALPGFTRTERAGYIVTKKSQDTGQSEEQVMEKLVAEIPARRIGEPEEFGAAVAFLCTPAAAYINGINLPVDGGRTGSL